MSRIAQPAFNGAPTDELAAVDVYGTTDAEQRSAFTSAYTAFGEGLDVVMNKSKEVSGKVVQKAKDGELDVNESRKVVQRALKGSRTDIDRIGTAASDLLLGDVAKGSMLDQLGGGKNYYKSIKVLTQNGQHNIDNADYDSVSGILAMVSDVTGSGAFEATNLAVEAAVLHTAIEQLTDLGVPELVDDVMQEIKDEQLRKTVARRSAGRLATSGNIDTIEIALNSVGAPPLTASQPTLPQQVLARYKLKEGSTRADYPERLVQLVRVMNQLKPDWFWTYRGSERVWNLAMLSTASDDARLVLLSDEEYRTPTLIASSYPQRDVTRLMKDMYPMIAIAA
jgi:hypothetical protein